jgi:hypothetical protein
MRRSNCKAITQIRVIAATRSGLCKKIGASAIGPFTHEIRKEVRRKKAN